MLWLRLLRLLLFDSLICEREDGGHCCSKANLETSVHGRVIQETALETSRDCKASDLTAAQKRRLSLAVELLSDRRVLLLDQPFVGLVAAEALEIMNVLKRLAGKKVATAVCMFLRHFLYFATYTSTCHRAYHAVSIGEKNEGTDEKAAKY